MIPLFKKNLQIFRRLHRILVIYIKIILAKIAEHHKRSNFMMSVACELLVYLIMSENFPFTSQMIKSTKIGNQNDFELQKSLS